MVDITWHISIQRGMMDGTCLMMKKLKKLEIGKKLSKIAQMEKHSLSFYSMRNRK